MKSIITQEVLDQVWEIGHQRVIELVDMKEKYPRLTRQIDTLRQQYIICLNSISTRDFNRIEKTRIVINNLETEIAELQKECDADERRNQKAKKIKEEASMEELKTESEEKENGK